MPEYHNIQGYISLEHRTHQDAVRLFAKVLADLALDTPSCLEWLDVLCRDLTSEDGYPPRGPTLHAAIGAVEIEFDPLVMHWTSDVIATLSAPWLQVGLLIESERIELPHLEEPRFRPELEPVLLPLAMAFAPISRDAPTFLTNEATDGLPWESFVGDDGDPWAFDLAVAHASLAWPHSALPPGFNRAAFRGATVISRGEAWHALPWRESA